MTFWDIQKSDTFGHWCYFQPSIRVPPLKCVPFDPNHNMQYFSLKQLHLISPGIEPFTLRSTLWRDSTEPNELKQLSELLSESYIINLLYHLITMRFKECNSLSSQITHYITKLSVFSSPIRSYFFHLIFPDFPVQ